jgi:hypothetical protein
LEFNEKKIIELYSHRVGQETYKRGDDFKAEMEGIVTRSNETKVEPLYYIAHLYLDERNFSGNLYYLLHALIYNYDPNDTCFIPVSNSSHCFFSQMKEMFTSTKTALRTYHKNEEGRFPKIRDSLLNDSETFVPEETIKYLRKLKKSEALQEIEAKGWKNKISWTCYSWIFRKSDDSSSPTGYAEISDPDNPDGRIVFNYLEGIVYYSPDHYRPCPIKPEGFEGKLYLGEIKFHNGSFRLIK